MVLIAVHPRRSGVLVSLSRIRSSSSRGSSPRPRGCGRRCRSWVRGSPRFIPARAGPPTFLETWLGGCGVHPRVRGVATYSSPDRILMAGVRPRVRGASHNQRFSRSIVKRFIPACGAAFSSRCLLSLSLQRSLVSRSSLRWLRWCARSRRRSMLLVPSFSTSIYSSLHDPFTTCASLIALLAGTRAPPSMLVSFPIELPYSTRCQATSGIDPPATPKTDPPKKRRMLLKWGTQRGCISVATDHRSRSRDLVYESKDDDACGFCGRRLRRPSGVVNALSTTVQSPPNAARAFSTPRQNPQAARTRLDDRG